MRSPAVALAIVLGFTAGIGLRSFAAFSFWLVAALVALGFFLLIIYAARKAPVFALAALVLIASALGILRYDWKDAASRSADLDAAVGRTIALRGVIAQEPDERERATRLVILARELDGRAIGSGLVLATVGRFPEFSYGDIVELRGIVKTPENFDRDFDYRAYLAKDGILWEFYFPEIQKIGKANDAWIRFRRALFAVKRAYLDRLGELMPEPNASLVGGLTVGARKAMPEDVLDDFRAAGVLHIVVLSGYNMTLIARMIAKIAPSFIPYAFRLSVGLAGIAVFALMAGASATVVRASLMAAILYVAGISGRVYQAKIALVAAGILMLAFNPKLLRFDLSFQLSFLATAGLLWLAPTIEFLMRWFPKFLGREYAVTTIAAQIAVTPLLLYSMGTISLSALPANILILLAVPPTMAMGAMIGLFAMVHAWAAMPFAWIAYLLTHYELWIARVFAAVPFAEVAFPDISIIVLWVMYIGIGAWLVWPLGLKKSENVVKENERSPLPTEAM
ncbi:MAG: ComEC family competence protein [Candidatus Niyogibacteria bacterium]|nr:ComEC family competence protein [Candidatus Niyogibacteria bacterium]